jgi:flavin-dependent dehydrogenase
VGSPGFDVVIVGGGPGGCAAALGLRKHAPGLSVALLEASAYQERRLGETLPPAARRPLEHLGVWEAFREQGHRESFGTAAAWGGAQLYEKDFIYNPAGSGWHLDRTTFDAMLAEQAQRQQVSMLREARVREVERVGESWHLGLASGQEVRARFVVDATGRAATIARRLGARALLSDHLVAFARFFEEEDSQDPRTMVESFSDGWWYAAGLPGGLRVVACLTDADIARRLHLHEEPSWFQLLRETAWISQTVRKARECGPPRVRATESRRLEPAAGTGWLAVGDAASVFDPLSSQGILKALRSGIFAAYAIAECLTRSDDSGAQKYDRFVCAEFMAYSKVRAKYYDNERRWPEGEFWRRRRGPVE